MKVLFGILVFVAVFLQTDLLPAQAVPKEVCLSCHGVEGLEKQRNGKPLSLYVNSETFSRSVHRVLGCTACHSGITQIPHAPDLKPVLCSTCHVDASKAYSESVHGKAYAKRDRDAANCSDCHGRHNILSYRNPGSQVYPLNLPRTCGTCHGDPELAKRHGIRVTNAYQLYMDSIHGRALTKSGLLVAAQCSSCHGSHEIRPKDDPESRVYRTNVPSTCATCHAGILGDYFGGVHGRAVIEGNVAAPVCIDCHTAHEITRVETLDWKLEIIRECGTCHEESLRSYRDTFHGQVTGLGFTRVARCSDCHNSHMILPSSDPKSSVSRSNLVVTCRKCHPKANENFTRFSPHADPKDKERYPGLYYSARFMNILLVGVFAFFGLHTALWLSRSIVERARQKIHAGKPEEESDHSDEERGNGPSEP